MYSLPSLRIDIFSEDSTFEVIVTYSNHSVDRTIIIEPEKVVVSRLNCGGAEDIIRGYGKLKRRE